MFCIFQNRSLLLIASWWQEWLRWLEGGSSYPVRKKKPLNPKDFDILLACVTENGLCSLYVCYKFSNSTPAYYKATITKLQCVCYQIWSKSESKETWYFYTNYNECLDDFLLRVKLRRPIRSGPPKPAPATCILYRLVQS